MNSMQMDKNQGQLKIVEIINEVLETPITMEQLEDDLEKVGMDSLGFVRIIVVLEETFECGIPDSKLLVSEMNTVNKMWEAVQEALRCE